MLQFFRNMRISNKLFVAYACACVCAFAVAGSVIYNQTRDVIRQSIELDLSRTNSTIVNMVHTTADASIKNYMRAVAEKNYEVAKYYQRMVRRGKMSIKEAQDNAKQVFLSQKLGKTGRLYCLDSKGVMAVHPKRSLIGVDVSGLRFVKEQIKNKEGYLEYEWKEPLEKQAKPKAIYMKYFQPWDWIISASADRNEFSELVNINDFRQRILGLEFGKSGYTFVMDYDGNIIMHPTFEGKNYKDLKTQANINIGNKILAQKNGKFEYKFYPTDGSAPQHKIVYFNDIPQMGWIVASTGLLEDFYEP